MAFSFRNMQTFIRNCIEPHVVALNRLLLASIKKIEDYVNSEIEKLKKLLKDYQKTVDDRFDALKKEVQIQLDSKSTIPVGMIAIWPTAIPITEPEKWFDCDGSVFSTTRYPGLFRALGKNSLPDYRGYFLRGVGGNSASLGVHQSDRIRNMTGAVTNMTYGGDSGSGCLRHASFSQNSVTPDRSNDWTEMTCVLSIDASRVVPTGPENNPINKSVRYLIRALD